MPSMTLAAVALGSNEGDREKNLRGAIEAIGRIPKSRIGSVSGFIATPPAPPANRSDPAYLNGVALIETELSVSDLHRDLQAIEASFGRVRSTPGAPRTLDLDLLLFGDAVVSTPTLTVPHPRMHERRFVLAPLAAIAPTIRHPVLKRTAAELLAAL